MQDDAASYESNLSSSSFEVWNEWLETLLPMGVFSDIGVLASGVWRDVALRWVDLGRRPMRSRTVGRLDQS